MMRSYSLEFWSVFVEARISPYIIFLSAGELGIRQDSVLTPSEMRTIRTTEAENAMRSLQASLIVLSFPDMHLPFVPIQQIVESVLPIVREHAIDAIFSFWPYETTKEFDHPDHNVTGLVAKHVGAAADVKDFMPQYSSLTKRPRLFLWTSDAYRADYTFHLTESQIFSRAEYLLKYYPSQFSDKNRSVWESYLNTIQECYFQVR